MCFCFNGHEHPVTSFGRICHCGSQILVLCDESPNMMETYEEEEEKEEEKEEEEDEEDEDEDEVARSDNSDGEDVEPPDNMLIGCCEESLDEEEDDVGDSEYSGDESNTFTCFIRWDATTHYHSCLIPQCQRSVA